MIRTKQQAARTLAQPGRFMMLTYDVASGPSYATDHGVSISRKVGASLTGQGELFGPQDPVDLIPSDDGLFPGFSQTWRAPHAG